MADSDEAVCEIALSWTEPLSVVLEATGIRDSQEALRAYVDYLRRLGAYNCVPPSDELRFRYRIVHPQQSDQPFEEHAKR